ncbi:glycosyltransferase family 2 protein [Marinobacter mobilis]|uniref:Glycosyl transferase family 2 n=1 Tax=Marinobacter mobilis TaxID=488533 RepID=A0A1H2UW48_9GAMM|nr:glycosyltransferase [Marinobacter mobilis]SDW60218.1 Glycosyl transferase family 2 [Marinobacter mobilis]
MSRFSIVVPIYNCESKIAETIDSIISEMSDCDELLLIDDCSSDSTPNVVQNYLGNNIKYFCLDENSGGPSAPRNYGIEKAIGEYVVLFDSDDIMMPGKLNLTEQAFNRFPIANLVFTNFNTIDESGEMIESNFLVKYDFIKNICYKSDDKFIYIDTPTNLRQLAKANYIGTSGVAIRRKLFDVISPFDSLLKNGDDYDMWLRISRISPFVFVDEILHSYRITGSGISNKGSLKLSPARIEVLKRQLINPLDREFCNDINYWIYRNYISMSKSYIDGQELYLARRCALNAMRSKVSWEPLKIIALSFLGNSLISAIRNIRKS